MLQAFSYCSFFSATLLAPFVSAQSLGDFQTRGSGNWNKSNTWEEWNGSPWINNKVVPDFSSGQITIRLGHSVNGNAIGDYDQVVIEAGATLSLSKSFTILDGPGTDLHVFGTLVVGSNVILQGAATAISEPNSALDIGRLGSFAVLGTSSVQFLSPVTIASTSDFIVGDAATATLASGSILTNGTQGVIDVSISGSLSFAGSTVINEGLITTGGSGTISFDATSEYVHAQDGGSFPPASSTTWATGSTASITGADRNTTSGLDASFSNFVWNSPAQSKEIDLQGVLISVSGDLTISSTGSGSIMFSAAGTALNIGGNYTQDGGNVVFQDTGSAAMTVGGDFQLNVGTFNLAATGGTPVLDVNGDLLIAGALENTGSGTATISLSSASTQIIDVSGSLSGLINLELNGSGGILLANDLTLPGSLTETIGGLDLNGFNLTLSGSLTLASLLQNAGLLTFNGPDPSTLSAPSPFQVEEMVIDKAPSTLTLLSDLEIGTSLIIRSGDFDVDGFNVILAPRATFYNASGAPFPGTVTIERSWTDSSDGWLSLLRFLSTSFPSTLESDRRQPMHR